MIPYNEDLYFGSFSEYDEKIDELKDSLRESLKKEIKEELSKLRLENRELKEFKNSYDKLKRSLELEYFNKNKELDNKLENHKKYYFGLTVGELFDDVLEGTKPLFRVERDSETIKCDKCNEKRYIETIDKYGRTYETYCKCNSVWHYTYAIKEAKLKIGVYKYRNNKKFSLKIEENIHSYYSSSAQVVISSYSDEEGYYNEENNIHEVYDKENMKKFDMSLYFTSQEEAQKYVDYLQEYIPNSEVKEYKENEK